MNRTKESKRIVMLRKALDMALVGASGSLNSDRVLACFRDMDEGAAAASEDAVAQMMVQVSNAIRTDLDIMIRDYGLADKMARLDQLVAEQESGRGRSRAGDAEGAWTLPKGVSARDLLRALAVRSLQGEKERLEAECAKAEGAASDLNAAVQAEAAQVTAAVDGLKESLESVLKAEDALLRIE